MSLHVFDQLPMVPYGYRDELPYMLLRDGGPTELVRVPLHDIGWRVYTLPYASLNDERQDIDDFFRDRAYQGDGFLIKDPRDDSPTVPIGTGNGSNLVFSWPTTGELRRFYPANDSSAVVKLDGTPWTHTVSVNTDARTITLSGGSAPGMGVAVTVSVNVYRYVVLDTGGLDWKQVFTDYWNTEITLREILAG